MQSATTGARAAEKSAHFSEASGVTVAEAEGGVSKRRWRGDGALALVAGFATLEAQEEVLAAGIGGLGSSALSLSLFLACLLWTVHNPLSLRIMRSHLSFVSPPPSPAHLQPPLLCPHPHPGKTCSFSYFFFVMGKHCYFLIYVAMLLLLLL